MKRLLRTEGWAFCWRVCSASRGSRGSDRHDNILTEHHRDDEVVIVLTSAEGRSCRVSQSHRRWTLDGRWTRRRRGRPPGREPRAGHRSAIFDIV